MSKISTTEEYKKIFNNEKSKEALKYALDIRKFEIELYWKRATYFWTFISIALGGYVAIYKLKTGAEAIELSFLIACLGTIFSLAWLLVNMGSKYWQENWEHHVDLLEDEHIGPLYKTIFHSSYSSLLSPYPYSVSKINQVLSFFILIIWIILLLNSYYSSYFSNLLLLLISCFACFMIFFAKSQNQDRNKICIDKVKDKDKI